jgi:bifunctional enzyme CysN/CysC
MAATATATAPRELLRLATAGSVDDGKSTLIGRLLLDTKLLLSDQLDAVTREGEAPDLAAITDGLRAEREQGITIDVAYRFFATPRRSFILADTPGHERYTRNMFTGASTADLALVLVDAGRGVVTQTRRHMQISALLGIRHVVACVNKMDLVDWDQARFAAVAADVSTLADRLEIPDVTVVPISALHGDNVVERSERTPWYDGPPVLERLEAVDVSADRDTDHLRLPIQWVARPADGRGRAYAGRLAAGTLRRGDAVAVLPSGVTTEVVAIDALGAEVDAVVPPLSVTIELADEIDAGRGDVLVSAGDPPPAAARELEARLCWMAETPLRPGRRYALKHTTRTVRATVQAVHERVDAETLETEADPPELVLNDIGRVTLRTSAVVVADAYSDNRVTGAFILIDEHTNDTVGAGLVLAARAADEAVETAPPDVTWHPSSLDRGHRWAALRQTGATVWLTGLPASGKSTIAAALERRLVDRDRPAYLLDGDNVRHGLSDDLGFSPGDRAEHIRRVGHVARLMADAGVVAVVSLVSPLRRDREVARQLHEAAGLAFVEVHVDTPLEECERRDPKGLYARARAGDLPGFTGIGAPYEPPADPELRLSTTDVGVDEAVEAILERLAG